MTAIALTGEWCARYYDPGTGRFLQKDPHPGKLSVPGTVTNSYIYTLNNPTNRIDPSGKFSFGSILAGVAIIGAAVVFGPGVLTALAIARGISAGLTGAMTGDWSVGNLANAFLLGAGSTAGVAVGGYAGAYLLGGFGLGGATAGSFLGGAAAGAGMAAVNGASGRGLLIAGLAGGTFGMLAGPSGYNAYLRSSGAASSALVPEMPAWAPNSQPGSVPIDAAPSRGGSGDPSCPYAECLFFPDGMSF